MGQPPEQQVRRALPVFSFAIFAIVVVSIFMVRIVREDRAAQEALAAEPRITGKRGNVIAKVHSTANNGGIAYVYAVETQHRFPDGTVREGWLVEPAHLVGHGDPVWVIPPKGRVEWLQKTVD